MLCKVCRSFYVRPPCPECENRRELALENLGKPESGEEMSVLSQKLKTKSKASESGRLKGKAKSPATTSKRPTKQNIFVIPSEELPSSTVKEKLKARKTFTKPTDFKKPSQARSKPQKKVEEPPFPQKQTKVLETEYKKKVRATLTKVMSLLEELVKS